jgi:hypothetical protein
MSGAPHTPELPLTAASLRLRRRPGRPRANSHREQAQGLTNPGPSPTPAPSAAIADRCRFPVADPVPVNGPVAPLRPRLVDLAGAAAYP